MGHLPLRSDLAPLAIQVPEHEFPMDADLGIWSWRYDEVQEKGIVRIYQRVSKDYPWLCTYFGADVGQGVKANQACEYQLSSMPRLVVAECIHMTTPRLSTYTLSIARKRLLSTYSTTHV